MTRVDCSDHQRQIRVRHCGGQLAATVSRGGVVRVIRRRVVYRVYLGPRLAVGRAQHTPPLRGSFRSAYTGPDDVTRQYNRHRKLNVNPLPLVVFQRIAAPILPGAVWVRTGEDRIPHGYVLIVYIIEHSPRVVGPSHRNRGAALHGVRPEAVAGRRVAARDSEGVCQCLTSSPGVTPRRG